MEEEQTDFANEPEIVDNPDKQQEKASEEIGYIVFKKMCRKLQLLEDTYDNSLLDALARPL